MLETELNNFEKTKLIPFPISHEQIQINLKRPLFSGPLSGAMWEKVSSLGSQYRDTFDWSVYDTLYDKFGEKQPRGGVVFKTHFKLGNFHPECSKCHYSFEIDTYGRGCIHNCVYCYAKDQLTLRGFWNRPHPMPVDLSEVRKIFHTVFETNKASKWRKILESRVPLRIGSMSDSFMWMDKKYRVTLEFLKILKFYQYPYVVFTRSDLIAAEEYLQEIDPKIASVQFSISGANEEITKLIEPGAPSIKRRLQALKKLRSEGVWTAVRINPLFPTYPDGYFSDHKNTKERFRSEVMPKFSLLDIERPDEFLSDISETGNKTVLAGFVRLNQTSISQLSKATGINIRSFFKPENYKPQGESHYSDSEVAYYYKVLQSKISRLNMRFSSCYIGNGLKDYYQYQDIWANKADCCDIVGNVAGFKKTAQSIAWEDRLKHASTFKEIAERTERLEAEFENTAGLRTDIKQAGFSRIAWKNKS